MIYTFRKNASFMVYEYFLAERTCFKNRIFSFLRIDYHGIWSSNSRPKTKHCIISKWTEAKNELYFYLNLKMPRLGKWPIEIGACCCRATAYIRSLWNDRLNYYRHAFVVCSVTGFGEISPFLWNFKTFWLFRDDFFIVWQKINLLWPILMLIGKMFFLWMVK